ncbi:uncharacterized protein N7518_005839, partial [Penicillium psychrosexuale]|uniref:uncharacterized protein n=1 Tax=Penicillium psychrosexuale TaxID=1002107 RepID=UPI0025452BB3
SAILPGAIHPLQGVICLGPPPPLSKEETIEAINNQARPAADVARILDEAQVANILWGTMTIGLVGKWKMHVKDVEFLILDHLIPVASEALITAGLMSYADPDCGEVQTKGNDRPIPAVHFHIEAQYPQHSVLRLYPKSGHLWWLPDF